MLSGNWANNDNDDSPATKAGGGRKKADAAARPRASRRRARRRSASRLPARLRPKDCLGLGGRAGGQKGALDRGQAEADDGAAPHHDRAQAAGQTDDPAGRRRQRLSDRWRNPFAHAIGGGDDLAVPISRYQLAAGQGTRMRSDTHKVLHPIAGKAMLMHLLDTVDGLGAKERVVVVGKGRDQVEVALNGRGVKVAHQAEQKGTAHAVQQAETVLSGFEEISSSSTAIRRSSRPGR